MNANEVVFEITRGSVTELMHRGAVAVTDVQGQVQYAAGNPHFLTYLRSSAKPLQVLPMVAAGGMDRFGFRSEELAIMCGSHNAEPIHLEPVRGALAKMELDESALQCGPHYPLHQPTADAMRRMQVEPTAIHSNCSGKHTAMLALAKLHGFSIVDYLERSHPGQQLIHSAIADLAGLDASCVAVGTDGCGAPVFAMPLAQMARLFARLAVPNSCVEPTRSALAKIASVMTKHPNLIAGQGRLCTALMEAFPGQVIAKSGAAGVYCVGLPVQGWGIAVKVEDGDVTIRSALILDTLRQLGILPAEKLSMLWEEFCPPIRSCRDEVVGEIRSVLKLQRAT